MENYYFSILFNDISKYNVLISLPIYDLLNFFWINFIVRDNSVSLNIDGDMSLVSLLNSVPLTHTHTHSHVVFSCFMGTSLGNKYFYTVQIVSSLPLH